MSFQKYVGFSTFLGLLVSVLFFFPARAQSQTYPDSKGSRGPVSKGSAMIGGSIAFSSITSSGSTLTQFQLAPAAYAFLVNNVALGGRVSFVRASMEGSSSSALSIGPALSIFFPTQSGTFPFLDCGFFLDTYRSSYTWGDETETSSSNGSTVLLGLGMAILVKPNSNLAIVPEFALNFKSVESESATCILLGVGLSGFLY